ncbi:hypothetical protein NBRC116493_35650 [Aurantivibrio infirmus]
MTVVKENAKQIIKEFEEVIKQEDLVGAKLKDYLYSREFDGTSFKDLFLNMQEIQSKKRQLHRKLRSIRNNLH